MSAVARFQVIDSRPPSVVLKVVPAHSQHGRAPLRGRALPFEFLVALLLLSQQLDRLNALGALARERGQREAFGRGLFGLELAVAFGLGLDEPGFELDEQLPRQLLRSVVRMKVCV